jgi:Zn-dependent oligopeptidase
MHDLLSKEQYEKLRKNPKEFLEFLNQFADTPKASREEEIKELKEVIALKVDNIEHKT